jgi:hypothetical protein
VFSVLTAGAAEMCWHAALLCQIRESFPRKPESPSVSADLARKTEIPAFGGMTPVVGEGFLINHNTL